MKKIINILFDFIKKDFGLHYIPQIIILITLFYFNYNKSLKEIFIINDTITYLFPFIVLFIIPFIFHKIKINYLIVLFFIYSLFILGFNYYSKFLFNDLFNLFNFDRSLYKFVYKNYISIQKFLALFIPLIPIYFLQKKDLNNFYGLSSKNFEIKPYIIMLGIMLPLIFIAAESDSFQRVYPRYKPGPAEANGLISEYYSIAVFELIYFLRFFAVEIFFRGFLVIGLSKLIREKAILPVAIIYSAWHFGKPMGEAIGAFFGGYILGILAYKTESIYGGIMIHYGVALLMELCAWYWILYG